MLEAIAWISLCVAFLCALIIAGDEVRHPQKMWVMNIVWPVTALYFSVLALWGYYRIGKKDGQEWHTRHAPGPDERRAEAAKQAAFRDAAALWRH